ncbi:MAG: type 4a pilus biogenesis protein PilO [Syntrophales bacterium]|jgi:type IV pilus assembly protein PilO|nr:type 4a pilus biogenesis protein PilO [Syntrophales bacterium]
MAITVEDIKKLSPQKKALALAGIYLVLGYFFFFFFIQSELEKKGKLDTKLQELNQQVADKSRIAAQKDKHLRELNALRESFKMALTKLPNQREIPALFHAVSVAGREAGVDFLLFEPAPPTPPPKPQAAAPAKPADKKAAAGKPKEPDKFYDDIPVRVTVTGNFQGMVLFFEKVAKLPRIVNIENISMGDGKDVKGRGRIINTNCIVKTYMFVEKASEKGAADAKKK